MLGYAWRLTFNLKLKLMGQIVLLNLFTHRSFLFGKHITELTFSCLKIVKHKENKKGIHIEEGSFMNPKAAGR